MFNRQNRDVSIDARRAEIVASFDEAMGATPPVPPPPGDDEAAPSLEEHAATLRA